MGPQNVKQVRFQGVHCVVGGGYTEAESGLSKIALEWMLEAAKAEGLLVDPLRGTIPVDGLVHQAAWLWRGGYRDRLSEDAISVGTRKL